MRKHAAEADGRRAYCAHSLRDRAGLMPALNDPKQMPNPKMGVRVKSTGEALRAVSRLRAGKALPVDDERGKFESVTEAQFAEPPNDATADRVIAGRQVRRYI